MAFQGIIYVHIHVSDIVRTKRFYGETLGWKLETDMPEVGGFWFGTGYLVAGIEQRPESERIYNGGMHTAVRVDDLEAQHALLGERGVAVSKIQSRPWGQRDFFFSDPDGYRWEYVQVG
jgi:catechol 2,3-dioxygenase-like lactoylglutathione lyase family enzyme